MKQKASAKKEEENIMKLGKKLLAVALAGVLALSVLTGCSGGSGSSSKINGNELARLIGVCSKGDFVEDFVYDSSLNKTAEAAMNAVKAKVGTKTSDGVEITMDNALKNNDSGMIMGAPDIDGTLLGNKNGRREIIFSAEGAGLKSALKVEGDNKDKGVRVALINTKYLKGEQYALANLIAQEYVNANYESLDTDYYKVGYYESGNYLLVVMVGEKNA